MRIIVLNQYDKFIIEDEIIKEVEHMVNYGYGSFIIDNRIASYDSEVMVDGDRVIHLKVGEI